MAAKERQTETKPMIFIGLGTSGAKIVGAIKQRLKKDPFAEKYYRYLGILSETNRQEGTGLDLPLLHMAMPNLSCEAAIKDLLKIKETREEFERWWYRNADNKEPGTAGFFVPPIPTLETGVGGWRCVGRALLHRFSMIDATKADSFQTRITKMKEDIEASIMKCKKDPDPEVKAQAVNMGEQIDCYLFGLLAGGTCSGMIIDTALLIRSVMPTKSQVVGVYLLGDVCHDRKSATVLDPAIKSRQKYNTLYALAELSVVQSNFGFSTVKDEWVRKIGLTDITTGGRASSQPPYNFITLVGPRNQAGYSLDTTHDNLDPYLNFIAEFYTSFFKTQEARKEINSAVDDFTAIVQENFTNYPHRANCFQRIGRKCVQAPRNKIRALINHSIAESVGMACFKNGDATKIRSSEDYFYGQTGWSSLLSEQSIFAPCLQNAPTTAGSGDLPDTSASFDEAWKQTMSSIKVFYAGWTNTDTTAARAVTQVFETKWRAALDKIERDLLGLTAGSALSLGSIGSVINDLSRTVEARLCEIRTQIPILQANMVSQEQQFCDVLETQKSDFPSKSILNLRKRKIWSGSTDVEQALTTFKTALHSYALHNLVAAALEPLREELRILSVVRRLVASHAATTVFDAQKKEVEDLFSREAKDPTTQELIADKDDIQKNLVIPILQQAPVGAGGEGATLLDAATALVRISWSGDDRAGIWRSWQNMTSTLRQAKTITEAEHLRRVDPYKKEIEHLQTALSRQFEEKVSEVFGELVDGLSVWDTIRLYIEKVKEAGADPDQTIKNMFKVYLQEATHFTRIRDEVEGNAPSASPKVFYSCNMEAAVKCFSDLGFPSPETYLAEVMSFATGAGAAPRAMGGNSAPRDRVEFFQTLMGENPAYYEGYQELDELLGDPIIERSGNTRRWSDVRFPTKWIPEWRKKCST